MMSPSFCGPSAAVLEVLLGPVYSAQAFIRQVRQQNCR